MPARPPEIVVQSPRHRIRRGPPLITRHDVTAAALALLDRGGLDALSMREVCRILSVSLPTIYSAGGPKSELLVEATAHALGEWWPSSHASQPRPWLYEVLRRHPDLAAEAAQHLGEVADCVLLRWSALELADRLTRQGLIDPPAGPVLAAVVQEAIASRMRSQISAVTPSPGNG